MCLLREKASLLGSIGDECFLALNCNELAARLRQQLSPMRLEPFAVALGSIALRPVTGGLGGVDKLLDDEFRFFHCSTLFSAVADGSSIIVLKNDGNFGAAPRSAVRPGVIGPTVLQTTPISYYHAIMSATTCWSIQAIADAPLDLVSRNTPQCVVSAKERVNQIVSIRDFELPVNSQELEPVCALAELRQL
jgi:hypothetical protein